MQRVLPWIVLLACAAHPAAGDEPLLGPVSNVWMENDLVVMTDQHYTHGSRISHTFAEQPEANHESRWDGRLADSLPNFGLRPEAWRGSLSLTQNIYTPVDTAATGLMPGDRPYAGWLYMTGSLLRRGTTAAGTPLLDVWTLQVGVVGPAALGEKAQNGVHRIRSLPLAQGWANQLSNEPDIATGYARAARFTVPLSERIRGEFIPHFGVRLGTVQTFASVGAQWRLGFNPPRDFGWRSIDEVIPASGGRPMDGSGSRGFHLFFGVEGRVFGHNMLLQGNLFHDSHHVDMQPFVGEVTVGAVYSGKRWDIAYTHQVRSNEFQDQGDVDSFGSFSVAYKW
jgi:hypothetical protein